MKGDFIIVIPARYASSRLPAKPLLEIAGKPMIYHTWHQAQKAGAKRVVVATDDERIVEAVESFGGEVCMTSKNHSSGTERLREVVEILALKDDEIVVNVQGDEPLIPPSIIQQVAENLQAAKTPMATLGVAIDDVEEIFNPNVVKVVRNKHNHALYFSRAPMPWARDEFSSGERNFSDEMKPHYLRHIGLYAYRAGFIKQYVEWTPSPLETLESLEQLRVLWHGEKIHIDLAKEVPAVGVDTQQDLDKVRMILTA